MNYTIAYHLGGGWMAMPDYPQSGYMCAQDFPSPSSAGYYTNPANPYSYRTDTPDITLLPAYRYGYTFEGWYDNSGFSGSPVTVIHSGSTGDINLYAKWEPIVYYITYNLNGGTQNTENPDSYTVESSTITFSYPTRAGYNFGGWFEEPDFSGDVITGIPTGSTGDVELYAKWNIIMNQIVYALNGGTQNSGNPTLYTIETEIELLPPERERFTFGGWFNNPGFLGEPILAIPAGSTGTKYLYAAWIEDGKAREGKPGPDLYSGDALISIRPNGADFARRRKNNA